MNKNYNNDLPIVTIMIVNDGANNYESEQQFIFRSNIRNKKLIYWIRAVGTGCTAKSGNVLMVDLLYGVQSLWLIKCSRTEGGEVTSMFIL